MASQEASSKSQGDVHPELRPVSSIINDLNVCVFVHVSLLFALLMSESYHT
jgi:hypothetical protein